MRKIVFSLAVAALLSAVVSEPAFADRWGRHSRGRDAADALLWPITAALTLPAAIIGTVAQATIPPPFVYGGPPVAGPADYAGPRAYYYSPPPVYVVPGGYYEPRVYYAPRRYYHHRGYHHYRGGRW